MSPEASYKTDIFDLFQTGRDFRNIDIDLTME